jgi:hypothetical protein
LKGLKRTPWLSTQKLLNSSHLFFFVVKVDFTIKDSWSKTKVTGKKKEDKETSKMTTDKKVRGPLSVHCHTPHQTRKSRAVTPTDTLQSRRRGCTLQLSDLEGEEPLLI